MAEQRTPIEAKTEKKELTPEEIELNKAVEREALKKKLRVNLLERGLVSSALAVDLPPDVHGQWVRNDPLRIRDAKELGFEIDKVYAPNQGLHDARADGSAVVGDLIFMTCSKQTKEIIDELRAEEYLRRHGKPGETNQAQAEEKGFLQDAKVEFAGTFMSTANESRANPVSIQTPKKE